MGTTVNLQLAPDTFTTYANFAVVQYTPTEMIVRFCLVDPLRATGKDEETGTIDSVDVPVAVSVFLSPDTARSLVSILIKQMQEREEQFTKSDEV